MTLKYSANVGFLWDHLSLPDRIVAAHKAGFDAVECHFPYEHTASEINKVLEACNLSMVGINTVLGPQGSNYFGLAALEGKEEEARKAIDQAITYAGAINASCVNVVAGVTKGTASAGKVYVENLQYACEKAASLGITILIEPLSTRAVADTHFSTVEQGVAIIEAVACDNIKLMFDCFHTQIMQGDIESQLKTHMNHIGHIQISAVHDRGEPDCGEINYSYVMGVLDQLGYAGYIGAEYRPRGESVESGLGWLSAFREL